MFINRNNLKLKQKNSDNSVDNQFTSIQASAKYFILLVVALVLSISLITLGIYWHRISDPYVRYSQEVLSLQGDTFKGRAIFEINCAACHGIKADGIVGPSLKHVPKRKSKIGIIHQVISGKTPPMPKFQPNTQEMADLLSYLEQL